MNTTRYVLKLFIKFSGQGLLVVNRPSSTQCEHHYYNRDIYVLSFLLIEFPLKNLETLSASSSYYCLSRKSRFKCIYFLFFNANSAVNIRCQIGNALCYTCPHVRVIYLFLFEKPCTHIRFSIITYTHKYPALLLHRHSCTVTHPLRSFHNVGFCPHISVAFMFSSIITRITLVMLAVVTGERTLAMTSTNSMTMVATTMGNGQNRRSSKCLCNVGLRLFFFVNSFTGNSLNTLK